MDWEGNDGERSSKVLTVIKGDNRMVKLWEYFEDRKKVCLALLSMLMQSKGGS